MKAKAKEKLRPLPVIEDLAIGTAIVGLIWWFASLRGKSEPAGAAVVDTASGH